jgi:hypothetical protein
MRAGSTWVGGLVLAAAVLVVFGPGTRGGFVWDDHALIANNAHLRDAGRLGTLLSTGLWDTTAEVRASSSYYRPVVALAYFVQFQAFGLAPLGYHWVNVLLHLGCVLLLLDMLRHRIGAAPGSAALGGAFAGALLFAVHPTRTESVTWISGCTDLWMTLLCLLALRVLRAPVTRTRAALGALLAALALLAKESAVVLPLLLALDAWLLREPGAARREQLRAAGFAAAGMALALALRVVLVPLPARSVHALLWSLPARVASSFGHYLHAAFWPLAPTALRGKSRLAEDGAIAFEPLSVALGCLGFAAFLLCAVYAVRRPRLRPWLADASWFAIGVAPALNLFPLELKALVADRFLYLPMIGIAALLARTVATVWPALGRGARGLAVAVGFAVSFIFATVTVGHGRAFASEAALWAYELAHDPERPLVLEQNAELAAAAGKPARAVALARAGYDLAKRNRQVGLEVRFALIALEVAARATPDSEQARLLRLREFYDALAERGAGELALAPVRAGDRELAPALGLRVHYSEVQRALLADATAQFHVQRARLHARTLALASAAQQLEHLVRVRPRSSEAWVELALVQGRARRFADALHAAAAARSLAPADASAIAAARALGAAAQHAARPAADRVGAAVRDAQVDLLLGAYEQARRRIDPLLAEDPRAAQLIALRIQVDALDRRVDLATARLRQAQRALPEDGPRWSALLAEIAALR